MAAAINLATATTGVSATVNGTSLELKSTDYGSNAFVNVNTVSGTQAFTLSDNSTAATQDNGTDIQGTINGTAGTGAGQNLSLNTAALSLSANISATGNYGFKVLGGGALFQLGPDVVGGQQAQIGIQNVSSGSLGGSSGNLFELGSGQDASLATNPSKAGQILQQALNDVTSLRGRLGAVSNRYAGQQHFDFDQRRDQPHRGPKRHPGRRLRHRKRRPDPAANPRAIGHHGLGNRQLQSRERPHAPAEGLASLILRHGVSRLIA